MNYLFKILFLLIPIGIFPLDFLAQTCCSGGVPLSGNVGFESSEQGTIQLDLSYDLNYLATLKNGTELYSDELRRRTTQSVLLKAGYTLTPRLAVDLLASFVQQGRSISYQQEFSQVTTRGLGDGVILLKYIVSTLATHGTEFQLGAGPKIPLGRTDKTDERGITLNADLQPGSGSWDLVLWTSLSRQLKIRPTTTVSARMVGKLNGANRAYLGSQEYRFGHSLQAYLGMADQMVFRNRVFGAALTFKLRHAWPDRINGNPFDNTGGSWVNVIPSMGWYLGPTTIVNIVPEIPLYSRVEGIQLTPTFRFQAGIYHRFGWKKKSETNIYQL